MLIDARFTVWLATASKYFFEKLDLVVNAMYSGTINISFIVP
jgi:hypothetical protein